MKTFRHKIYILFLAALTLPFTASAQCAMCRAALQTGDQENMAEGINHGITYLMAFPYIMAATLGFVIYRIIKKESSAK